MSVMYTRCNSCNYVVATAYDIVAVAHRRCFRVIVGVLASWVVSRVAGCALSFLVLKLVQRYGDVSVLLMVCKTNHCNYVVPSVSVYYVALRRTWQVVVGVLASWVVSPIVGCALSFLVLKLVQSIERSHSCR